MGPLTASIRTPDRQTSRVRQLGRQAELNAVVFDGGPEGARRAAPSNPSAGKPLQKKLNNAATHGPLDGVNSNPRQTNKPGSTTRPPGRVERRRPRRRPRRGE